MQEEVDGMQLLSQGVDDGDLDVERSRFSSWWQRSATCTNGGQAATILDPLGQPVNDEHLLQLEAAA